MERIDDIGALGALRGDSAGNDDEFSCALEQFVAQASQATTWHIDRVLKASAYETTELVSGAPAAGPTGRYVRKRIDASSGTGAAYRALWRAQHAGSCPACVPRLVELTEVGDELTVVMEFVDGVTVAQFVGAAGAGLMAAHMVVPPLCAAVASLHEGFDPPLIHRDLKPSNVIMRDGAPVIIDFGSARQWREGAESDTAHFLTRCYAPPEQFGFGQTDARSDEYALGKMLYFCLTGGNPPNVCDVAACEEAGLPADVAGVLCRACAFDPNERYEDVRAFGRALERALGGSGVCEGVAASGTSQLRGGAEALTVRGLVERGMSRAREAAGARWPAGAWLAAGAQRVADGQPAAGARPVAEAQSPARLAAGERLPAVLHRGAALVRALWNACLLVGYGTLVAGSVMAVVAPNAHDASLPMWFRILEYGGVTVVAPGALVYLLLAKGTVRTRLAAKLPATRRQAIGVALAVAVAGVAIPLIAGLAAGLI